MLIYDVLCRDPAAAAAVTPCPGEAVSMHNPGISRHIPSLLCIHGLRDGSHVSLDPSTKNGAAEQHPEIFHLSVEASETAHRQT